MVRTLRSSPSIFRIGPFATLVLSASFAASSSVLAAAPALQQSQIKGLLVVQLGNGEVAGAASQMNATVVPGQAGAFSIGFNQPVGPMMKSATVEVQKFIRVRHGDKLPKGHKVELAFADKYTPKDGPSAAVVCALLTDSIITGKEIDPNFAATGDMTAAGEVRPVGGIMGKIRGATKKGCKLIGLPEPNKNMIEDLYIIEGIEPLFQIQIFSIATFDEARKLAVVKRDEDTQTAVDEFAKVQDVLKKNPKLIRNGKVREKLRAIVKLAPNHYSARLLFLHGAKKGPKNLSLPGSLTAIDNAARSFGAMMADRSFMDTGQDDVLGGLLSELQRLRPMLDKRTKAYNDAYEELADYIKEIRSKKIINAQIQRNLNERGRRIESERRKLLQNKEVREELMMD